MKLVTLFALTCPERISALASLDLRHCSVLPERVSFKLTVPRKTGSADKLAEDLLVNSAILLLSFDLYIYIYHIYII